MINSIGKNVRVFLQKADGEMMEVSAMLESLSITTPIRSGYYFSDNRTEIDMHLVGDSVLAYSKNDARVDFKNKRQSPEWQCDFCGRPNSKADETCKSCGAVRSFIYDI